MKTFKISLETGNKFWTPKGIGAMGMDPHRAIAELVANSLDWRRVPEDNLQAIIIIKVGRNNIEILDNGVGMTIKELQDAVQLSVSNDAKRKNLRIRKGMFGMGMKVACLTLGWKIKILTRSIGEKNQDHYIEIDTKKLDNYNSKKSDKDFSGKTTSHNTSNSLNGWESGTSISIENLIFKNLNAVALRDAIQEIFSPEISTENVQISVEDVVTKTEYKCQRIFPSVFEESTIKLDDLDLFVKDDETGKKIQITGWIGLLKIAASGTGKWGLHLFRNNQIIERFHQLPVRLGGLMPKNPHPVYARTYGEIHLDMCKPAFHKVGFDYNTLSWKKVQGLLSDHIKKIMDASNQYKAGDYQQAQKSLKSIQRHKKAAKNAISKLKKQKKSEEIPNNAIVLPNNQWFTLVEPIFEDLLDVNTEKPWIYHFRSKSKELALVINKRSEVYEVFTKNEFNESILELIVNWAITDCLIQFVYEYYDLQLSETIAFKNKVLKDLFNKEEEVVND